MLIFFIILSVILGGLLVLAGYYIWKFVRIIMILEDDFSDSIISLEDVEKTLLKLLNMRLFFDSPEVKMVVQEALGEVKTCRLTVNRLIQRFVERSKQKYTVIEEEESVDDLKDRLMRDRQLRYDGVMNNNNDDLYYLQQQQQQNINEPIVVPTRGGMPIREQQ